MNITRASDFAIRILVRLAVDGEATTCEALAKEIDVPYNHVAKIVQLLARRGFLLTRRGKCGGLSLAVDPRRISLADVIEAVEGPLTISHCVLRKESCRFSPKCKVRTCFGAVQAKIRGMLADRTILEMARA
ncbi:MAG: Rrf2 family transcriptional regulator [Candidatus Margulisiibacteriota bacterium]